MTKTIDRRSFLKFAIATVAALFLPKPTASPASGEAEGAGITTEDSGKLYADSASARIEFNGSHELLSNIHTDLYTYTVLPGDLIISPDYYTDNALAWKGRI